MASGHYRTFYQNQRGYSKALRDSELRIQEIEKLEKQYNAMGVQISELYAGIYDKPKPPELQEIEGWIAYILSGNVIEASIRCKIPIGTLQRMAKLNGWDLERKNYYDHVKLAIQKELEEKSLPKQVDLAAACINRAFDLANAQIKDEKLTELERAQAVKELAEVALMLQGDRQEQQNIPGLSAKANNLFMQVNQFMDKSEDSEIDEEITEITNIDEETIDTPQYNTEETEDIEEKVEVNKPK